MSKKKGTQVHRGTGTLDSTNNLESLLSCLSTPLITAWKPGSHHKQSGPFEVLQLIELYKAVNES